MVELNSFFGSQETKQKSLRSQKTDLLTLSKSTEWDSGTLRHTWLPCHSPTVPLLHLSLGFLGLSGLLLALPGLAYGSFQIRGSKS